MTTLGPQAIPLPPLTEVEAAHVAQATAMIRDRIVSEGPLSFAEFMGLALYAPGLGYYSAGAQKFGEAGDFVTAPEISALFSRCMARQCEQVLQELEGGDLLEVGAGSGAMAVDILKELEARETLPQRYLILEVSADLRQRQRQRMEQEIPHLLERVEWLDSLPEAGFRGVIVANELLDALPVHRFRRLEQGISELGVEWRDEVFSECDLAEPTPALVDAVAHIEDEVGPLPVGFESEINLALTAWVKEMAQILEQGALLLVDYGYPRRTYYQSERARGTLMCHFRHRAHSDPFILAGLQDITAYVDFTAVAEAGHEAGLDVEGYTTQAFFLMATGLTEMAVAEDPRQQLVLAQQVKTLTLPGEMGERFQVMALGRGLNCALAGFCLQDMRHHL